VAQDRVGAVVERLNGWNQSAPTDPDERDGEQLGWQLAGQLGARIVPRQRGTETCKVLENFLTMVSTENASFCQNSFGKTIFTPKTASAGERPVSSLGCALSPTLLIFIVILLRIF
jgi:hypothetical protein